MKAASKHAAVAGLVLVACGLGLPFGSSCLLGVDYEKVVVMPAGGGGAGGSGGDAGGGGAAGSGGDGGTGGAGGSGG
jgi:hypothetical protein